MLRDLALNYQMRPAPSIDTRLDPLSAHRNSVAKAGSFLVSILFLLRACQWGNL